MRRKTRQVKIGNVKIGGNAPISIQSMTKTDTKDVKKTAAQIKRLEKAGCEIIRVAVKDKDDARAIAKIKRQINIPLEADIHFNYKLAIEAISYGADAVRLNPGNIRDRDEIEKVAIEAKNKRIPIRVGLNSGSVRRDGNKKLSLLMTESARQYIKILEGLNFYDIIVSLKASTVSDTIDAYRLMAKYCDYPFHLGITATGGKDLGIIKSSIGIGALLMDGIGDTIRVSLTDEPEKEVLAGKDILQALGLRRFGPEIISCPTCGRCRVDLKNIVNELEKQLFSQQSTVHPSTSLGASSQQLPKIAVMGCEVNGPGEARDADIGIACGNGCGVIFRKGKIVKKVAEHQIIGALLSQLKLTKTGRT